MTPQPLLAKSPLDPTRPRRGDTLPSHTNEVLQAGRALLQSCGAQALHAAGLALTWLPVLERRVLASCLLHDLGKCSDHFQAMVRQQRQAPQLLRHEALSALLCLGPLSGWLEEALPDAQDRACVLAAVSGHHRKFPRDAKAPPDSGAGLSLSAQIQHPDFERTLRLASGLGWPEAPRFPQPWVLRAGILGDVDQRLQRVLQPAPPSEEPPLLWALVKGLTLAADVAGSSLPREGARADWIPATLSHAPSAAALSSLAERRLRGQTPRPFQQAVGRCDAPLSLVTAGCGSGKTVAAYLWAAQHPGRKLWFLYPTTGTATEGFRDYLVDVDLDTALEHSRRNVDLELLGLRGTKEDPEGHREQDRLEALRVWGREAVSATADTVLGMLQNQRKGLYALPALVNAALVFDEIHAYDARMFGTLLRWLRAFPGLPTLLMTASLPEGRLLALNELCQELHGRPLPLLEGPEALETLPRYRRVESADPLAQIAEVLGQGGKVLWVSNTVARCMEAAEACAQRGWAVQRYHSRFRYEDRVARHAELIEVFRGAGPALACTTQVAEMSLDLSADLLVTDLAPVPALIQRLGRLNRRAVPESPSPTRPLLVLRPERPLPYADEDLEAAQRWLERLPTEAISQRQLVRAWVQDAEAPAPQQVCAWLDGGPCTEAYALREGSPGLTVLLSQDASAVSKDLAQAPRYALPMPPPPRSVGDWTRWPRLAHLPVVPSACIHYDARRGASWQR